MCKPVSPLVQDEIAHLFCKAEHISTVHYRYMANRPANETKNIVAKGYFVTDLAINYTKKRWEAGLAIQNLFDVKWKETGCI